MDNTYYIREIRRLYGEYISETERLEKDRKVTEGLMGIGRGLGTHPCHDRFSERLGQLLDSLAANAPSAPAVREVLAFMYDMPLKNRNNTLAFWMLQAVHSLTERLIGFLTPEDAAVLLTSLVQGMAIRWSLGARNFSLIGEGKRLLDVQLRLLTVKED